MNAHVNGKKHLKNASQKRKTVNEVKKSDNVVEKNLVVPVVLKPVNPKGTMCDICDIPIIPENMENHVKGKKHMYRVKEFEEAKKRNKCAIKVSNYSASISKDALLQYFRQFGKFKCYSFNRDCLFVYYKEQFMAEKVLSTPHYFENSLLTVERAPEEKTDKKSEDELDLNAIALSLKDAGNFQQQLSIFMNSVRPEFPGIIDTYKRVCYELEITLRKVFMAPQVHAFGSTITGLCFKDSDVDVYVQLPAEVVRNHDSDQLLRTARKALFQSGGLFNDIMCIFNAKTPIVKCCHVPTGIRCDFNFRNMLGVCNSRLITYYLSLDPKLTPLMLILKFWGKTHEISGSQKFTNYSLTMLMIYYLQQPPFNLPSVKMLQQNFVFNQGGWNGGFLPVNNFHSDALRNTSLIDLFKGFLDFYLKFDFGLYVISPFIGQKLAKMMFFNPDNLSDDFIRYKAYLHHVPEAHPLGVDGAVCLQDPFELTRNVCGVVHVRLLEWFLKCCKQSYDICSNYKEDDVLYQLFTNFPKSSDCNPEKSTFQIRIAGNLKYFYENLESTNRTVNALRTLWFETLNSFLLSVLTLVLQLDVEIEPDNTTIKSQKLSGQKDVYDTNIVDTVVFHCTGKRNLWEQRKSWFRHLASELNLPPKSTLLDKEIALTQFITKDGATPIDVLVDFNLMVTARTDPTLVEFEIKRNKGTRYAFHTLYVFFISNFATWFATYLADKSKEVDM